LFSDGELIPAELVQRAATLGLEGIALTDHVDTSNLELVLSQALTAARDLAPYHRLQVAAGVEFTHLPPEMIAPAVERARELGAQVVVVHGQTLVEPVPEGTNRAAIEAGVDILAHPGLITPEEVALAAERGVALELSARKGHCLANGHVARLALELGAALVVNTDAHAPSDLIDAEMARRVALGAGVPEERLAELWDNSRRILARALGTAV
jgi:histidinol phosphatase-like PHP family hydrolase